jgi:hypothetical protein
VHTFGVLDQPEYEISFVKHEWMNLLAMVSSQLLLIECGSGQGLLSCLLEEVNTIFTDFFCLLLRVLDHSGRIKFNVGGQHCLCPIDQEERGEADRAVGSGAQALEY